MLKRNIKPIGVFIANMLLSYATHKIIFEISGLDTTAFIYSLEELYGFFTLFSIVIAIILSIVKEKNIDIVGSVFLLITSVKMMVCFLFGRPIIKQQNTDNTFEKWNFFTLFIAFLLFEAIFTIYLLNAKSSENQE